MKELHFDTVSKRVSGVRKLIQSAGNHIGSVHFRTRGDGSKRRMCYRLHTSNPTYAKKPGSKIKFRKTQDRENKQMTVLDCNKVLYNRKDKISGRGAWRTIPLENVTRVCVGGVIYKIS